MASARLIQMTLEATLSQINMQIDDITKNLRDRGMNPLLAKNKDGSYILAPLLLAKATALSGLAHLAK